MFAVPSDSYNFVIGDINFLIERKDMEMFPGVGIQLIVVNYEVYKPKVESGICLG